MVKEKWYIRLLKWLGIIKEYEVSKKEMCEKAQLSGVCSNSCLCCAWYEGEE